MDSNTREQMHYANMMLRTYGTINMLSVEMKRSEVVHIGNISNKHSLSTFFYAYLPYMVTEHCIGDILQE